MAFLLFFVVFPFMIILWLIRVIAENTRWLLFLLGLAVLALVTARSALDPGVEAEINRALAYIALAQTILVAANAALEKIRDIPIRTPAELAILASTWSSRSTDKDYEYLLGNSIRGYLTVEDMKKAMLQFNTTRQSYDIYRKALTFYHLLDKKAPLRLKDVIERIQGRILEDEYYLRNAKRGDLLRLYEQRNDVESALYRCDTYRQARFMSTDYFLIGCLHNYKHKLQSEAMVVALTQPSEEEIIKHVIASVGKDDMKWYFEASTEQ